MSDDTKKGLCLLLSALDKESYLKGFRNADFEFVALFLMNKKEPEGATYTGTHTLNSEAIFNLPLNQDGGITVPKDTKLKIALPTSILEYPIQSIKMIGSNTIKIPTTSDVAYTIRKPNLTENKDCLYYKKNDEKEASFHNSRLTIEQKITRYEDQQAHLSKIQFNKN